MKHSLESLAASIAEGMREALRTPSDTRGSTPAWLSRVTDFTLAAHAEGGRERLAAVLSGGMKQAAERIDEVSIVATGLEWLGGGVAAVERTLADLVASANREIVLTVYSLTPGSERVCNEIERALATGVRCTLVVDHLQEQHAEMRSLMERLANDHPDAFQLYDFAGEDADRGLHAKVLVVDRKTALVGSANLSHRGMVTAHELAVVVQGPTAELIAGQVDRLVRSAFVTRVR